MNARCWRRRNPALARWLTTAALFAALGVLGSGDPAAAHPANQVSSRTYLQGDPVVQARIAGMSSREKVGQLFLVPFDGEDPEAGPIAELVTAYHIGGVILDPTRGNFSNEPDAPSQVARLVDGLQSKALSNSPGLPLLVALEQTGDAYPGSLLSGGMTPLPSNMAIGATWNPDDAERIGQIVGRELAAAGVNLLLGPNLDVLAVPQPGSPGDLGVRSFGGSPQWVGQLGARYIEGVHGGSGGRVATAAGHFPGIGGADRSADEEVAVVEKTYQQLAATELVPFAAVTGGARPAGATDALVTSHVRYRGIQQQMDRPLSLDSGGIRYLLSQVPGLNRWRAAGGVLISPGLGLPAVRRYDDPNERGFNHRRVIRESLAAGHDVIVLTGLGQPGDPSSETQAIEDGINWLAGVYDQDEAVRDAVDDALPRVLQLKRRLSPELSLADVSVDPEAAGAATGVGTEDVLAVAREALTRITPAGAAGPVPAVDTPQLGDRLLFVVDARQMADCPACPASAFEPDKILASVRRTYGRQGAHRIEDENVQAITFSELKAWLQSTGAVVSEDTVALVPDLKADRLADVDRLVRAADWIVFCMRDVRPAEAPGSDALKLYLKTTPPDSSERRIVAISFTTPYLLDTTEIAKLSAYYAVYARSAPFVEVAVRALFGDEAARGTSPVSVPGAGYDLYKNLEPADQDVALEIVGRTQGVPVEVGTNLTVRTSAIHDANGHAVPDGTPVTFRRFARSEGLFLPDVEEVTEGGRGTASMRAERPGELEISAVFANGLRTESLVVVVEGGAAEPTEPPGSEEGLAAPAVDRPPVDWGVLLLSLGVMVLAGVIGYVADPRSTAEPSRMLRTFLLSLSMGLGGYLLVVGGGLGLGAFGAAGIWPASWNAAYQAPLFSFGLALVPTGLLSLAHGLPRGEDRQQQEEPRQSD